MVDWNLLGSKKTRALTHANSSSSSWISFIALTSSSMILAPILDMSKFGSIRFCSGDDFVMILWLPNSKTPCRCIDLRDTPSNKCSPAWPRNNATWSSSWSSAKAGMDFAHSTRIRSCCFIESQTSWMLAYCLLLKSLSFVTSSSAAVTCRLSISALSKNFTDNPLPAAGSSELGRRQLILSRSFWTASFFIPALKHLRKRQYRHWLRLSLSTTHWRENLMKIGKT